MKGRCAWRKVEIMQMSVVQDNHAAKIPQTLHNKWVLRGPKREDNARSIRNTRTRVPTDRLWEKATLQSIRSTWPREYPPTDCWDCRRQRCWIACLQRNAGPLTTLTDSNRCDNGPVAWKQTSTATWRWISQMQSLLKSGALLLPAMLGHWQPWQTVTGVIMVLWPENKQAQQHEDG